MAKSTTVKVRKADGTEKVIKTDKAPINQTGNVQGLFVTLDKSMQPSFKRAVTFWESLNKNVKKTLAELSNLGKVLHAGKQSVQNNNNVFSLWRNQHFPNMTPRYASYAIQLNATYDKILEKFAELKIDNRMWSNPESVMNAYNKAIKTTEETPAKTTEKTTEETTEETDSNKVISLETLTPEKRIESLQECCNMVIESFNSDKYDDKQVKSIIKVIDNLKKVLTD